NPATGCSRCGSPRAASSSAPTTSPPALAAANPTGRARRAMCAILSPPPGAFCRRQAPFRYRQAAGAVPPHAYGAGRPFRSSLSRLVALLEKLVFLLEKLVDPLV